MNNMTRGINKKTFSLGMIAAGVLACIPTVLNFLMDEPSAILLLILAILTFIVVVALLAGSAYMIFAQKVKDKFHIAVFVGSIIATITSFLQMKMYYSLNNIEDIVSEMSSSEVQDFISGLGSDMTWTLFGMLVLITMMVLSMCYLYFNQHVAQEAISVDIDSAAVKEKAGSFLKSKNGKITVAVVAVLIVLFAGYKVWDTFFNKTAINLVNGISIECNGYSGTGSVSVDTSNLEIDYNEENEDLSDFVNSVDYEIVAPEGKENGELSNGDTVTIRATYDEDEAKDLKLEITGETTAEVSGLTVKYKSAGEVDQSIITNLQETAVTELENDYNSRYNEANENYTFTPVANYLRVYTGTRDSNSTNESLIMVYKGTRTVTNYDDTTEEETRYFTVTFNDFDSSYLDEDNWGYARTYSYYNDYASDAEALQAVVDRNTSSYYEMQQIQ